MNPGRPWCEEWAKLKEEWGSSWEDRKAKMLRDFGHVIRTSSLAAMGCVVDSAHFRAMPESRFKREKHEPMYLSLLVVIGDSLDRVDIVNRYLSVSLIIDDDPQYAMACYDFLNQLKEQLPRVKQRISAVTFGNDEQYPGLQMADMISFEARTWMVAKLKDKSAPPSLLLGQLTRMGVNTLKLWDAEYLDKAAQRINEKGQ